MTAADKLRALTEAIHEAGRDSSIEWLNESLVEEIAALLEWCDEHMPDELIYQFDTRYAKLADMLPEVDDR